jgi:hypothetical protein
MYELIRARVTDAVIVAVFVHRQRVEAALNLKLAQEYLRLPGVMRIMTTWLFDDPPAGCEGMLRLADVIQPHMVIATADELSFRACTVKNVSQRCYGADRNNSSTNCTRPIALAEYTNYGVKGVAHVPALVYPGTLMRPLRRADTPDDRPEGTNRFHGWPLPYGRPWWQSARFAVCPQWEAKRVVPLPGAYVNENLRPLPCNDTSRCAALFAPLYNPPTTCPRPPWEDAAPAPAPTADDYWEFPPRHTFTFQPPAADRPRRLAWSLVGSAHYGERVNATTAFAAAFAGLPSLV